WQWSGSTGADAVPCCRIFNPVTQSRRFDPDGRFIRHWIPELAHLDDHDIHLPPQGTLFSSTRYPAPMGHLKSSRQRALEAFRGNGRHAYEPPEVPAIFVSNGERAGITEVQN